MREILDPSSYSTIYEFVYDKGDGRPKWRFISVTEDDGIYIKGHDLMDNDMFKCFSAAKILGGENQIFFHRAKDVIVEDAPF